MPEGANIKKVGQVLSEVNQMEIEIASNSELVSELADRLCDILTPEPPLKTSEDSECEMVPLAYKLMLLKDKLNRTNHILRGIISRLEI